VGRPRLRPLLERAPPHTAGAIQLTDNFLDATHLPTVHTTTFGVEDDAFLPPHEVARDGWRASTTYVAPYKNQDDPLVATGEHPLVQTHHLFKELTAATTAVVRLTFPMTGGVIAILFSCLPEDGGSSKVFKVVARNDFAGDAAKIAESVEFEDRVLDEDLAILESYRHRRVPLDPRVEVHTRNDRLSLAYRRMLAELVA
jgi:vanillate O-demethylase monooxygenase subunit